MNQAKAKRLIREKELQDLVSFYSKKLTEELDLNAVTGKALGLAMNSKNICVACGFIPTGNGRCKC